MFSKILTTVALATTALAAPLTLNPRSTAISTTPHDMYGSSIGVLGCKINTNRVAYWPMQPRCDTLCVRVDSNGRSVHLLQIDTSGGAYDISYDAWNYLSTGQSATTHPTYGGGIPASYEFVDMGNCMNLLSDGKLPLMAANSINYYVSCPADSWVGRNAELFNIQNAACTWGYDEVCHLDMNVSNQPACPHQLGLTTPLSGHTVYNVQYGTGALVPALQ